MKRRGCQAAPRRRAVPVLPDGAGPVSEVRRCSVNEPVGIRPAVGWSAAHNALAETIHRLHKTELSKPRKPWRSIEQVELATDR
jgi:hypothetical protein